MYAKDSYKIWAAEHKEHLRLQRKKYYHSHKDIEKKQSAKWQKEHPLRWRIINRRACEKFRFGRNREEIFARDNFKCRICGNQKNLVIHHVDHNGRNKSREETNNRIENLITFCLSCHTRHHHLGKPKRKQIRETSS